MYPIIMDVIMWPMVLIMVLAWIGAIALVVTLVVGSVLIIRRVMKDSRTPDAD